MFELCDGETNGPVPELLAIGADPDKVGVIEEEEGSPIPGDERGMGRGDILGL
jgi:hypothetical protein